jgi:arginase
VAYRRHASPQLAQAEQPERQLTVSARDVGVTLLPYDSARHRERMGAGPSHLVSHGLLERLRAAGHATNASELAPTSGAWIAEIGTAFDLDRQLAASVAAVIARGAFPLTLAGNCISSIGTLGGLGAGRTGVLWFDAHGDFNTPESTVGGFLDGMALAVATGRCWTGLAATVPGFAPVAEEDVVLVGARALDAVEGERLRASRVQHLSSNAPVSRIAAAVEVVARRVRRLYVHVDLDVLDASEGRANGYVGGSGITLARLLATIEAVGVRCPIAAGAITAYDPAYDDDGRVCAAAIDVALGLAAAAR